MAVLGFGLAACAVNEAGDEHTAETAQALSMTSAPSVAGLDSGTQSLGGGFNIIGVEPVTATVFNLHIEAAAHWTAVTTTSLSWDADKVRQGQTLVVSRTGDTLGALVVTWNVSGTISPLGLGDIDIGTIPFAADSVSCAPKLSGADYECNASSPKIPIVPVTVPLAPYVDFGIGINFKITPKAASTTRTLKLDGEDSTHTTLDIVDSSEDDSLPMPCGKPAGTTVEYVLDPVSWSPDALTVTQQPTFTIGTLILIPTPIGPIPKKQDLFDAPFGPPQVSSPSFTLSGAGTAVTLGDLLANNVNPTVASVGPFSGQEGTPVAFSAATTSACPITSWVWQFSNGTTSYGPNPQRAFGDDGTFDGQLTVTDSTHLSGAGSFHVTISNVAPSIDAGPPTSGAWGVPIALNGQAVDPGSDDQATLTYQWDFGDGTPGTGGAAVSHAYAAPGTYTAKLTVCDDTTCVHSSTLVTVRKRNVAVAYTGANTGTYSASALLGGSIVDEFGAPVVGRSLAFTLAGSPAGSAFTNAGGNAALGITVGLGAGSYAVGTAFGGDGLYNAGSSASIIIVARMATTLTYTGSLTGKANKVVNVSAKLVDALDRPLAGQLVSFQLGTQSTTATTDATGVATGSIKLNQHNGSYQLTSSYAGNATQWTSSSASKTFTIGN